MSQVLVVSQLENWQVDPVDMQPLARHWYRAGSDAERKMTLGGVCFSFLGPFSQPSVTSRSPITAQGKHFLQGWISYYVSP